MRLTSFFIIAAIVPAIIVMQSCEKEREHEGCGEKKISAFNKDDSHNMGQNCMNCHYDGGKGEGCFIVAGTVYDSLRTSTYRNSTIRLYTDTNGGGQLRATVYGDGRGNFYTTESVDFSGGLFPAVTSAGGTQYMPLAITQGSCNSCHGNNVVNLWAK